MFFKWILSIFLVIGAFFTYSAYKSYTVDTSRGIGGLQKSIILRKGLEVNFDIFISGGFTIEISPLIVSDFKKMKLTISDNGLFSFYHDLSLESFNGSYHYFLSGDDNTKYTIKIEELDNQLDGMKATITVVDCTATASKNLYFSNQLRPIYEVIFYVGFTITSVLLCFLVFLIQREVKKRRMEI